MPGNLDLNIADEEEFSPDKLRANVERLYMTVVSISWRLGLLQSSWKKSRFADQNARLSDFWEGASRLRG